MCSNNQKVEKTSSVSVRCLRFINFDKPLSGNLQRCQKNSYDKITNPEGIINLGTSQNKIIHDLVVPKLNECLEFKKEHCPYFIHEGIPRFRQSVANFMERYMKPVEKIKPENIFGFNGCGSGIQALGATICDPGEGIIIPSPYYGGYDDDLYTGPEIVRIPAHLSSKFVSGNNVEYKLTSSVLEESLMAAKKQNIVVRALILCNPHNPLGIVFSEDEVCLCMKFCQKHSLHLISDEIYLLSIFKDGCSMVSVLAIEPGLIDADRLHVAWGFGKDFGISGIRAGVIYTRNPEIQTAFRATCYFNSIPSVIQDALSTFINDYEWLDNTLVPMNHQRLRQCHDVVSKGLQEIGVPFVDSVAGLFVWADLRQFIHPLDFKTERIFSDYLIDNGVYINFGLSFNSNEPGWFRIVFACDPEIVELGIERLGKFLKTIKNEQQDKE